MRRHAKYHPVCTAKKSCGFWAAGLDVRLKNILRAVYNKIRKKLKGDGCMNTDLLFVWLFLAAQILIALIYCFWGYRYFRVIMSLYVFLFVFPLAFSTISGFTSITQPVAILISLVISALAALLTWFIYKLAIFLCGGIAGVLIAFWLYWTLGSSYLVLCIILGIVLFILLGVLALKFQKIIIIFVSSLTGAFNLITYGLFLIFNYSAVSSFSILQIDTITNTVSSSYRPETMWIVPSIVLAIAGILVQALVTARGKD